MFCSKCGAPVAAGMSACAVCGESLHGVPLEVPHDAATFVGSIASSPGFASHDAQTVAGLPADAGLTVPGSGLSTPPPASRASNSADAPPPAVLAGASGPLAPGTAFGKRYHLIRLLGMGGMGAVYQAWDEELGVSVALKVIRPEITADPVAARDIERRFKRELLLARQVTHKNVVRIHDLGQIDGIKYLTMPYIQGSDLATVLRNEGKLSVKRTIAIARQVAGGLVAAHDAGVVHRDLKPANVMIDAEDQAVIMDFGISRSVSGGGATVAGAVIGTLEYMAPEQAMAQPVDHRADIYAFGLVMRDMLIGPRNAGGAETAVAELISRMQTPLPSTRRVDANIPEGLDAVIARCTDPNPAARYQATQELLSDLEALDVTGRVLTGTMPRVVLPPVERTAVGGAVATRQGPALPLKVIAAAVCGVSIVVAGWMLRGHVVPRADSGTSGIASSVALAVVPLRNGTGDPALDWLGPSVADMLVADIGQSSQLRLVPSERVFQLLRDLRIGSTMDLDPATLRRVGEFSSADAVAAGRFEKLGDQIRINVTLHSATREPVTLRATAAGENDLLRAAEEIAGKIRENLSLPPEAVRDLQSRALKPSSASVQALRFYNEGLQLAREGEHLGAVSKFEESTHVDPQFALAFSKLALSLRTLGRTSEAEGASRQAVSLSETLPAEERDLIAGTNARIINDTDKGIESFERLSRSRPGDVQLQFDLAELYETKGALDKARDAYAQIVKADPKHGEALYAAGRVAIQRSDFQGSLDFLNRALSIAIQLDKPESKARILQALGIAYRSLGKADEALGQFEQSLAIKKQIGDKRGIASSLAEIAYIHDLQGRPDQAVASYKEALDIRRALGDKRGVGITLANLGASYLDRGRYPEALEALNEALQIHRDTGDESWQARCLTNIGNLYFATARYEESRTYLERALELREKSKAPGTIALTLASLGDVSTRLGEYDRAQTQYLRAIELWRTAGDKRGAAIGSYAMGTLLEQQGRYGAAADAKGEALKTFRELDERSFWLAEILSGYGAAMSALGRNEEARAPLAEALTLAKELKNETLVAQTLNFQGDAAYFIGDSKAAHGLFQQARQAAERSANKYQIVRSDLNMAKLAVEEGRPNAAGDLRALLRETEALGLKPLAAESSTYLGAALLNAKNLAGARTELESALARSERLGARMLMARCHDLLAAALRTSGDTRAVDAHTRQARQILDEIQKEAKSERIGARHDLAALHQ
jgi:tetratricopeptide (TPR) repeat protein